MKENNMKKSSFDWINELHEKYYHLFETYQEEGTEKSYYQKGDILRGIECGNGWEEPVHNFLKTLQFYYENSLKQDEKIQIFQIKQKFGKVRTYVSYPEHLQGSIENAIGRLEGECFLTCERCGELHKTGVRKNRGWLVCLCDKCL